jgi:AcrR family transcriptional regulator
MDRKERAPSVETAPGSVRRDRNGVTAHELPHSGTTHVSGQARARERVTEIQRTRILAAMVEECAARGTANVTVAHVVERAGVSRRTFYELFSDCEDCLLGAFDDGVVRASRCVLDAYDPTAQWHLRIRAALTSLLSFLDTEPAAGRLLIVGSLGAGAKALERRQRMLAHVVAAVDEGRKESKGGAELAPLTADGVVGGVLSVLHSRLLEEAPGWLVELTGPLMGMIVLPYLGPAAARRENAQPIPKSPLVAHHPQGNPLGRLDMRLTYRTVRVLMAIAAHPGSSNRVVADAAEVSDQGQMSKLLARLDGLGLIENAGGGATRGEPNAWMLTDKGWQVQGAIAEQTTHG